HVPAFWAIVSLAFFARQYLEAGRPWLLWFAVGVRAGSLVLDFLLPVNLNFREMTRIDSVTILGERISTPTGVSSPWSLLRCASVLLLLVYLVAGSIPAWRRGRRPQALIVGGVLTPAILVVLVRAIEFVWTGPTIRSPYIISLAPLGVLVVMSIALSSD